MAITLSPGLTTEMDSLVRRPQAAMTVERFLPEWTEEIAHTGPDYAHGHGAEVAIDGDGAGEDILFRARISAAGELQIALIKGANLDDPTTWEGLFSNTGLTGHMYPNWSANSGASHGGNLHVTWDGGSNSFRVFTFKANGDVVHYDFDYNGSLINSGIVTSFSPDDDYLTSAQLGAASHQEVFIAQRKLVEAGQAAWHKDVYGTNLVRATESGGTWTTNASFLFHSHADAGLVRDTLDFDSGSEDIEAQWGFRPAGGIAVIDLDDDTALILLGMRFYMMKAYRTHTQGVMGFLYHRQNGIYERTIYNDEADYDSENQLWLDVFVTGSPGTDSRSVITWVRLSEPSDFEQTVGGENIPRSLETVYARVSDDGRNLSQFQYLGHPAALAGARILAVNRRGSKALYAIGYTAIYSSPPAHFLCDIPDAYKLNLETVTNNFKTQRNNRWGMSVTSGMVRAAARFDTLLKEGQLVRAFHGIPGELTQIGQGYIHTTAPTMNLAARSHAGPLTARAELQLLHTRAEAIEDIFPMQTVTIVPEHPGGQGSGVTTVEGNEFTVHHPANIAYHRGWWLFKPAKWPAKFFPGEYPGLENRLVYRMEAFPWAMTGGGPVDLPPGVYGGPGDIADPRKEYKRGTFFNDIVWVTLEPRIDGAIQSAVRFGDDRNYGNFGFEALSGCDVSTKIQRSNGLITNIKWFTDDCPSPPGDECSDPGCWNNVAQESVMAGLICRAVQGDYTDDLAGKKYAFVWEANSNFDTGSHLEDQAGRFWGKLVFDKPDYAGFPVGQNKFYLYISDFDDTDEAWQDNEKWVHKAVAHADATGLTPGRPAELKMQVLGGTIYCFYRPYWTGAGPRTQWRHAITYNSGHFGAGRFGLVGRGHSGIQWDVLWPGRNHIDQTDNVVDFWDIEATDCVRDSTLEELIDHYAWQGLTECEFRSDVADSGSNVVAAGAYINPYNHPIENPVIDFTVEIAGDGGEAGLWVRAVDNADPFNDCAAIGIVAHSTYKQGDNTLNCYVVFRRYEAGAEVVEKRDYSPSPIHLQPNKPYQVRVSIRNDLYSIWVEGNYVGHFHLDEELGQFFGCYTFGQDATFTNFRLPELHDVPDNATLDPNQSMMDAIKNVIGRRHVKGVWRPYGKLLVSRFQDHDTGPTLQDSLQQSTYQQSDQFYSTVEVQGATQRATYTSPLLLQRGRRYGQFNNPDIMTVEGCYREAKFIAREHAERMQQGSFVGLPDLRLEPEDATLIIVAQQGLNGTYLIDDVVISFDLQKEEDVMEISTRQQFIL